MSGVDLIYKQASSAGWRFGSSLGTPSIRPHCLRLVMGACGDDLGGLLIGDSKMRGEAASSW